MTLNEIVYDIREELGQYTDDTRFTDEYLSYLISNHREVLIHSEISNNPFNINDSFFQPLPCLKLVPVDKSLCCDFPTGCNVLRTENKIPALITTSYFTGIKSVTSGDIFDKSFSVLKLEHLKYAGNGRYNKFNMYVTLKDGYIYVYSKSILSSLLSSITAWGILKDPMEIQGFKNCSNEPCITRDSEYPITGRFAEIIKQQIVSRLASSYNIPIDKAGNATDDSENIGARNYAQNKQKGKE